MLPAKEASLASRALGAPGEGTGTMVELPLGVISGSLESIHETLGVIGDNIGGGRPPRAQSQGRPRAIADVLDEIHWSVGAEPLGRVAGALEEGE